MIYLYISNEIGNKVECRGDDKYFKININNFYQFHKKLIFEEYIFNIREDQLYIIPENKMTKHIILKSCTKKRQVVKQLGACHNFHHKIYFV